MFQPYPNFQLVFQQPIGLEGLIRPLFNLQKNICYFFILILLTNNMETPYRNLKLFSTNVFFSNLYEVVLQVFLKGGKFGFFSKLLSNKECIYLLFTMDD